MTKEVEWQHGTSDWQTYPENGKVLVEFYEYGKIQDTYRFTPDEAEKFAREVWAAVKKARKTNGI